MRETVWSAKGVALGCCVLVAALLAGCTGGEPRLPESDGSWAGSSLPEWPGGIPYSLVGAINLCIDRPGSIEITDVDLEHSEGGLRVDAFATRPLVPAEGRSYPEPETFTETLWELGFVPGDTLVDTPCAESARDQNLASNDSATAANDDGAAASMTGFGVQFSKPTDQTARGAVVRITYLSGGRRYVHRVGYELILCEGDNVAEDIPECDFRYSEYYGW